MPQLTGGQAVVAGLRRAGIDTLFAYPACTTAGCMTRCSTPPTCGW